MTDSRRKAKRAGSASVDDGGGADGTSEGGAGIAGARRRRLVRPKVQRRSRRRRVFQNVPSTMRSPRSTLRNDDENREKYRLPFYKDVRGRSACIRC